MKKILSALLTAVLIFSPSETLYSTMILQPWKQNLTDPDKRVLTVIIIVLIIITFPTKKIADPIQPIDRTTTTLNVDFYQVAVS